MSDLINEQLSALFDSEVPSKEALLLLKRLEQADELKSTWCRYQLIQDVIRRDELVCNYPKLIRSIDLWRQSAEEGASFSAPDSPDSNPTLFKTTRWKVWGASVAAALFIFIAVRLIPSQQASDLVADTLMPETSQTETATIDEWHELTPEMQARLSGYIINFDNYSSSERMNGVNPGFVRMVAYER